jgi:hypothetical protein
VGTVYLIEGVGWRAEPQFVAVAEDEISDLIG